MEGRFAQEELVLTEFDVFLIEPQVWTPCISVQPRKGSKEECYG